MSRAEVKSKRDQQIIELYQKKLRIIDIAERVGTTIHVVKRVSRLSRDQCPLRDPSKVSTFKRQVQAPPQSAGSPYPKRTIWIVPTSVGNGQNRAPRVPVSVRAMPWDLTA